MKLQRNLKQEEQKICSIWKCDRPAVTIVMEELHTECPGGEIFWLPYCEIHKPKQED